MVDVGSRRIEDLPSAIGRLDELRRRLRDRPLALFLDFDGTLAPIVERPGDAALPERTRDLLATIAKRRTVSLISGRDADDLRSRVGLEDLYYAGSHGLRVLGPDGWEDEHESARAFLPALDKAEAQLDDALEGEGRVEIERKRFAIAVHVRRASEQEKEFVTTVVARVADDSDGRLRRSGGREVLEIRPEIDWDKGAAVSRLLSELFDRKTAGEPYPVYVGDDETDEDAFRALGTDGLAVVVRGREGETAAQCSLHDPDEVRVFLERVDEVAG